MKSKLNARHVYSFMGFWTSLANATMFTTYAVYQVITLGLSPLQLLMVGVVLELTVLIFEGITGVIADVYSRKWSVIIGMFILGVGFVVEGSVQALESSVPLFSAFAWLLVSQLFFGIGYTFTSGADIAWIVDEVGEQEAGRVFLTAKRLSLFGTLAGIGISVGLSMIQSNLPYVAAGLMYLVLGFFLIRYMRETKFVRPEKTEGTSFAHLKSMKTAWLSGAGMIRRHPVLLMLLLVTVFSGAASEGYDRLWQAHLITDIGFPAGITASVAVWVGLISLLSTLVSLPVVWLAEKKMDINSRPLIVFSLIVLTALRIGAILLMAFAPGFGWALAAVLLHDTVMTLNGPIYNTWLNQHVESKSRATVISMMSQSDALGQSAGGPLVGWIGNRLSVRASIVTSAVLLMPVLGLFARQIRARTSEKQGG
ncbi:MFS transporter [Paenibacillus sp. GCM10012306]|uniref:MFS transporter n=1 Tax=Paenibacillus sp. GCM10012306 TaxID=3317342 RepID=UPI00360FBEEC